MSTKSTIDDAQNQDLPEMRERPTEMADGRYLIYYEFGGKDGSPSGDPSTPGDSATRPNDV